MDNENNYSGRIKLKRIGLIAGQLTEVAGVSNIVLVGSICTMMTFLTKLTSNTATTEMALPLLGSLAEAIKINPLLLMIPATLSASCAFGYKFILRFPLPSAN